MKNLNQYKNVIINFTKSLFYSNLKLENDINQIVKLSSTREGYEKINWSKYYENIHSNIALIKSKKRFPQEIRKIHNVLATINLNRIILYQNSVGTFHENKKEETPKINKLITNKSSLRPALIDIFHYIIKEESIKKLPNKNSVKKRVKRILTIFSFKKLVLKKGINIELHFKLYLIGFLSCKLATIVENQSALTKSETNLIELLSFLLNDYSLVPINSSIPFLEDINNYLQKTPHAFLNPSNYSIKNIGKQKTIEIAIDNRMMKSLIMFCKNHEYVQKTNASLSNNGNEIKVLFKNKEILKINLISKIKIKTIEVKMIEKLLLTSTINKYNVTTPNLLTYVELQLISKQLKAVEFTADETEYIVNSFKSNYEIREKTFGYISSKYNLNINKVDDIFILNNSTKNKISSHHLRHKENQKLHWMINTITFLKFSLINFFKTRYNSFNGVNKYSVKSINQLIKVDVSAKEFSKIA